MGRQNTIVFGSQVGTPDAPRPRTGTLVQERSVVGRARSNEPASPSAPRSPLPPVSAPPRYGSDPGPLSARAPASSRFESQWFAPTNPKLSPVGPEVFEERRGWQPPPASRGLVFTAVSVLLVGVAAAGTFFFLGPDANRSHETPPVSTTSITNAEVPAAPAPEAPPAPEATSVPTMTPADLPAAPSVVNAVKEPPPPGWRAAKSTTDAQKATAATPAPAPRAQQRAMAPARPATAKPATAKPATAKPATAPAKPSDTSLPNLDRAAAAAGMTPQQDDPFATPGTETPPAPATTSTESEAAPPTIGTTQQAVETAPEPSAPSAAPAPSDVMPDLQIKR